MMTEPIVVDVTSQKFKANPFPIYARWRAETPVVKARIVGNPSWLVTRYTDVAALFKDERLVKNRSTVNASRQFPFFLSFMNPISKNMLDMDAPDHTRLRGLVHKAFTPTMIERMRERIQALADELLDAAQTRGQIDLIRDYALPIPATIIAELLGIPSADQHKFHQWSNAVVGISGPADILRMIPAAFAFVRYLRRQIKLLRQQPGDDLLSGLIQAEEQGDKLSEDELLAMAFLLLTAGHETTVNLIGNATLALLQHRDQWDRLQNDPTLIKTAVEELARFNSPVTLSTERFAREDITIAGVRIPRGQQVLGILASANRDETHFENPDQLDITRENNRHLAFGQGMHYCVGAPLARLEGQIAINTLLRRMPDLRLNVPESALRWRPSPFLNGLRSLPVTF